MKSKQTILPILALIASIAIMTIPSALAEEDTNTDAVNLEIDQLHGVIAVLQNHNDGLDEQIEGVRELTNDLETRMQAQQAKLDSETEQLAILTAAQQANEELTVDELTGATVSQQIVQSQLEIDFAVMLLNESNAHIITNGEFIASLVVIKDQNLDDMFAIDTRIATLLQTLGI